MGDQISYPSPLEAEAEAEAVGCLRVRGLPVLQGGLQSARAKPVSEHSAVIWKATGYRL